MKSLRTEEHHIHFIGVGGIGMSALALILFKRGYSVSGSDQQSSHSLKCLSDQGVKIFDQQNESNITHICKNNRLNPIVVLSTAIPSNNQELQAAKQANLEIWHRSDLLAALIHKQPTIAIAGSHGKTTTSTIITTLLALSGRDPTAVIGGLVPHYKSNGHAGQGKLLIAEADESDGSLIKFDPELGVITNLELDHTDHYPNLETLISTMQIFRQRSKRTLANYDCPNLRKNFKASAWWSVKTYQGVDFAALPVKFDGNETVAMIYEKEKLIGKITLPLAGIHNLSNSIAAIGACRMEGMSFEELKKYMPFVQAPSRRFELRGNWKGRQIIDDYAHHPSEISATIARARLMVKSNPNDLTKENKRLVVVFQPHRYSRTKNFLNDFAKSLGKADLVLLAPLYEAGEKPIQGINNKSLAIAMKKYHVNVPVLVSDSLDHLTILVKENTLENDLIISMGAGDINSLWQRLQNKYNENNLPSSNIAA